MEQNLNQVIKKKALEKGIVLGIILLVAGIFSYYFITGMTDNMWLITFAPLLISVLIPLIVAIFLSIGLRKEIGGFWVFRQAVTGIFIMFFVANLLSFIGRDLIFAKVVEPNMVENMQTAMVNSVSAMLEKSGQEQSEIDKKIDDMNQQFEKQKNPTVGSIIQSQLIAIIFLFVLALIFAAIFKRDPIRNGLDDAVDPE
nr:DUF4199 domain-containing protein [uncultured Mucilaginibacter sp.]